MPKGVAVGRIVHFVMPEKSSHNGQPAHEHRPAIIVHAWNDDMVQLQVFTDGTNDGSQYASGVSWQTSVHYSDAHEPRTWHFPERVE